MLRKISPLFLLSLIMTLGISCTSNLEEETVSTNLDIQETVNVQKNLTLNGCTNVVIANGYAYAACGSEIQIAELATGTRNTISITADDITVDAINGLLFTQSRTSINMLSLNNPISPQLIANNRANFSIFSGLSAANGVLVVSGGAGRSNTRVFNYSSSNLSLATNGISVVDNRTGAPDVHVTATANGAKAFYSQDLARVSNWGIQIVDFDTSGNILSIPPVVVLTPGRFRGSFGAPFGPANFPVESEFLNNHLYVANFAAQGIESIDLNNNNQVSRIPLRYQPSNISTDGTSLFVLGINRSVIDIINPNNNQISSLSTTLQQPTGIAASTTHIAVADQELGLVVINRSL